MEPAFGVGFADVRIHRESPIPARIAAAAFTVGSDIHVGPGLYRPSQPDGQHLLAHELAHVVQQGGGAASVRRTSVDGNSDLIGVIDTEPKIQRRNTTSMPFEQAGRARMPHQLPAPLTNAAEGVPGAPTEGAINRITHADAVLDANTVVRRYPIKFKPSTGPGIVVDKDTNTMTYAELDEVATDAAKVYAAEEINAAVRERERLDTLITNELEVIAAEAVVLVDELNDISIAPPTFRAKVEAYLALNSSVVTRLDVAAGARIDKKRLAAMAMKLKSQLNPAQKQVVENLMKSGGSREKGKERDPEVGKLPKQILSNPVTIPGAKDVVNYLAPTVESTKHVSDKGILALRGPGALDDAQLHWVVNALIGADDHDPGTSVQWFALLDQGAPCWTHIKPGSAKDWIKHALLPRGTKLGPHYRGMYGELREAIEIIEGGDLAKDTKLTLGKHKAREKVPALKKNTPATQDVDIAFHSKSGERFYVEVKADPQTIVDKIGGDEDKSKDGVENDLAVADLALFTTPDQVLSYQSTKRTHEAKPTSKHYRPGAKRIVLVYASRKTDRWLVIFTSKAAQRLVKHEFHLRIGNCLMDAPTMVKVQHKVDLAIAGMKEHEIDGWVTAQSTTHPSNYLK